MGIARRRRGDVLTVEEAVYPVVWFGGLAQMMPSAERSARSRSCMCSAEDVLVDAIDERAVEIEEEGRSVVHRFVLPIAVHDGIQMLTAALPR
jgi:hypothetical protein